MTLISVSDVMAARYVTPILPLLALLEGGLIAAAASRFTPAGSTARDAVLAVATVALIAEPWTAAVRHNRVLARTDTRVLATRWLDENLPKNARLTVIGTRFYRWGAPDPPPGFRYIDPERIPTLRGDAPIYVVAHDHALYYSTVEDGDLAALGRTFDLLADFDPAEGAPGDPAQAIFEETDAYYVPFSGFEGVARPGPHIRVYLLTERLPVAEGVGEPRAREGPPQDAGGQLAKP